MLPSAQCPVCQISSDTLVETFGPLRMLRCPECTLEFCDPLEYSRDSYDRAYAGEDGSDFYVPAVEWLRQAGRDVSESRWMLFGAQTEALEWLQTERPGASVLDVGCGPGWFIIRASQLGFKVKAVEVGSAPVALLQAKGYDVVCGSLESVPADWTADVVTIFEVLEHLPNPVGFLSQVRRRFPESALVLSVPSPKRWTKGGRHRDVADYPPNHLTRWNPESMARALASAGYVNTDIRHSKPSALETASVSVRGLARSWSNRMPDTLAEARNGARLRSLPAEIAVRRSKCLPGFVLAYLFRTLGWSGISMLAIAH